MAEDNRGTDKKAEAEIETREKEEKVSPIELAWMTAERLNQIYSFITFEAANTDRAETYYRSDDGTYHPADFLPGAAEITANQIASEIISEGKVPPEVNSYVVNEAIGMVKRSTYVPRSIVNEDPNCIHVKNGVLYFYQTPKTVKEEVMNRLKTRASDPRVWDFMIKLENWKPEKVAKKWAPHVEEDVPVSTEEIVSIAYDMRMKGKPWPEDKKIFLTGIPVKYDPLKDCPRFKKFLQEVLPDEDDRKTVQEIFGAFLYRRPVDKAFFFLGEGANGKSTLIKVMKAFLGSWNITSRSLQDLTENRFAPADLYGKLANLYYDMPSQGIRYTGNFKALTSGDAMTVEKKFRDSFTFANFAKLVFSANQMPPASDKTDAYFRRWIVITFPFQFLTKEEIAERIKNGEDLENVKERDPNVIDGITTEEELSGILNWALEGLHRLIERGFFFSSELTISETREKMQRLTNVVHAFVMDRLVHDETAFVEKKAMYAEFVRYVREKKLTELSYESFTIKMAGEGIPERQVRTQEGRKRAYVGVRLKQQDELDEYKDDDAEEGRDGMDSDNPSDGSYGRLE